MARLFNFNPYLDFGGGGIRTLRHTTAATTITTTQQSLIAVFNKRSHGQAMFWMDAGANDAGMDMNVFRTGGNFSVWDFIPPSGQVPLNETHIVGGGDDVAGNAAIDSFTTAGS